MADLRIFDLTALTTAADADVVAIVDVTDNTGNADGTTKKITKVNLVAGLATLAAPTFTTSIIGDYLTASEILITDGSKGIVSAAVATYPSLTELSYVKGVTSAIQTQLDAKGVGDALTSNGLDQFAATTSAELAGVISNETGSGALVFGTSPTLVTPALGTPSALVATNATGTAAGLTVGATTGVEAGADVTDTANVTSSGALMDSELTSIADVKALDQSVVSGATPTFTNTNFTEATNKNYVTDAQQTVIGNTSGTNTGDQTNITGNAATVTTNANLTGEVTSSGNAAVVDVTAISGQSLVTGASGDMILVEDATDGALKRVDAVDFLAGSGDVSKVGTPVDSQIGVWTGDGTIEGDAAFTFDTSTNTMKVDNIDLGTDGTISALTLAEKASIALDPAGGADGDYSGITVTGTGGATIAFGDLVYLAVADSRWELMDASAITTSGDVACGMCVLASTDGAAITVLLQGTIRADAKFPTFTVGAPAYVSETAGASVVAQPTTTDAVIRRIGIALTADELYFNPSESYFTHT